MVRNIDGRLPERCWQRFGSTHLNVENVDGGLPGPRRGGGLHLGYERCVMTCIDMIGKK
jgi:hypothetical protein